jgi:PKD repeat protein
VDSGVLEGISKEVCTSYKSLETSLFKGEHMGRALITVIMVSLLSSSVLLVAFIREVKASTGFYVTDLVQVTDGTAFNRPGSLVRHPNGSFLLYSACYDRADEKHHLEVSFSSNGSAWSSPQRLVLPTSSLYPSAILDRDGRYWMAWEHQSNTMDSIQVASSSNGVDWSAPVNASVGVNSRPTLIQDTSGVYWVAYEDNSFGPEDIIVRRSTDGLTWSGPIYVTEKSDDSTENLMASMMQDANGIYWIVMARSPLVWDGGFRIWSSHSMDGVTWSPPVKIETGMESYSPHLVQGSSGLYVMVWHDDCYSASGHDNIWISQSDDCLNWTAPQRLTDREENSLLTCLLAEDDKYYLAYDVWEIRNLTYCEESIWMMTVKENPNPPVASFTYAPQPCLLGGDIVFDASASYDIDGQIVAYHWSYGDGSTAEGVAATHAYASTGNFTVTLTVVDNDGRASTTAQILCVDVASAFRGPIVVFIREGKTVAAQGFPVSLNIDLENMGAMSETYDLTLLVDATEIGTFTNITQPANTRTSLAVIWDTAFFTLGVHTVGANVVNHQGVTEIDVNHLDVCVSLPGDVDGNSHVNIFDMVLIADAYGLQQDAIQYNANCDVNSDGNVDIFDVVIAASHYGESWQQSRALPAHCGQ